MAEENTEELSIGEKEALFNYLSQAQGLPSPEEKFNVHSFLHRVATADDTTKVGYLSDEEVGSPKFPTRTHKGIALICNKVMNNPMMEDFFLRESEIITSTSLSKGGFLVNRAVIQQRQVADVSKPKKENKGWFAKKDKKDGVEEK